MINLTHCIYTVQFMLQFRKTLLIDSYSLHKWLYYLRRGYQGYILSVFLQREPCHSTDSRNTSPQILTMAPV